LTTVTSIKQTAAALLRPRRKRVNPQERLRVLQQYEQRGAYEQMFQLFRLAPASPMLTDIELNW
jgi:hypothetical protein